MFTMGGTFYAAIIILPQRFQAVYEVSAARAGIMLLPFTLVSPLCSIVAGFGVSKLPRVAEPLLSAGALMALVGIALLGSLPENVDFSAAQYGYEVILAIGLGAIMPVLMYLLKVECSDEDLGKFCANTAILRSASPR